MNKDRVLKLNLDHVLVDLVENGSYLFVLQFLDGYYYFARKVTSQDNNDHPPMRAGQHLLQSRFDQMCGARVSCSKCDINGGTDN